MTKLTDISANITADLLAAIEALPDDAASPTLPWHQNGAANHLSPRNASTDNYAQYVLKDWATSKAGSPAKAASAITLIHQDPTMRNEWPKPDARKWLKTHTGYTASKYERNAAKG